MTLCLNPQCQSPENPDNAKFCSNCGCKLWLSDRYRPIKAIGQGGFGRTFLAIDDHKPSKPYCVVKQFFPDDRGTTNPEKAAELFYQEAKHLDELGHHPQIPQLQAYFIQEQRQYLVQQFIDGQDLAVELKFSGPFTEDKIRDLLYSLLPVLQFIHDRQVIHRDIKPRNIIRRESDSQLFLVDFGAAKLATKTALLRPGTIIGTVQYIAPEQARGKAIFASDIYSLGVTCIHLLTRRRPNILFDNIQAAWVWQPYLSLPVSDSLQNILDKMLQTAIKRRYQSAAEILADLGEKKLVIQPKPAEVLKQNIENIRKKQLTIQPVLPNISNQKTGAATPALPVPPPITPGNPWHCQYTLKGHTHWVRSVAISPDSKILVSGSGDKTIKIWDLNTGNLLNNIISNHGFWITAIAISCNGQFIASGSADKTMKIWRLDTGEVINTINGHKDQVRSLVFSADGKFLVSTSQDNTIKMWRMNNGELIRTFSGHSHWVTCVAIAPDGKTLVSGSYDRTLKIWDINTGQLLNSLIGHSKEIESIAIHPQGKIIASVGKDQTIKLWRIYTGTLLGTLPGHKDDMISLAFSPNGQTLAIGSNDKNIYLWQIIPRNIRPNYILSGHNNRIWSIAFSPDGQIIASGSGDGTIKIWKC